MDKLQVITSYSYSGIYFAGTYRAGIYPARIFLGVAGGAGGRTDDRAVAYADDMYVDYTVFVVFSSLSASVHGLIDFLKTKFCYINIYVCTFLLFVHVCSRAREHTHVF